jgi:hypothetical protein
MKPDGPKEGDLENRKRLKNYGFSREMFYRPGALKVLVEQLKDYNADVRAIQEIRWRGTEVLEKE